MSEVGRHADSRPLVSAIRELPPEVVAQIKSSVTITSLGGVILELLQNSLDASATKVEVTVDFARGSCVIEDDGTGIPPTEFRSDGGLGRPYHTSKYTNAGQLYGSRGTFLASLAALSLLTVTSHHRHYHSTNSVTFHQSKAIARETPVRASLEPIDRHRGTRVEVRNLFGNMPVRVKQRAAALSERAEVDKHWSSLKRQIVSLLLAASNPPSLRLQDAERSRSLVIKAHDARRERLDQKPPSSRSSFEFDTPRSILIQAGYVTPEAWKSWVPVSASTPSVSVKGIVSLEPAPNKHLQFISLGIRSLDPSSNHNELYDLVNRLFSSSSFGVVEDDAVLDDAEVERRKRDRRFKSDGYTVREMRGQRKGIDRWPMFYLRVTLKNKATSISSEQNFLGSEGTLQAVVEVLGTTITQWLESHYFRPRKRRRRRLDDKADPLEVNCGHPSLEELQTTQDVREDVVDPPPNALTTRPPSSSRPTLKRKRPSHSRIKDLSGSNALSTRHASPEIFGGWNRIKSGDATFYDQLRGPLWSSVKPSSAPVIPRNKNPHRSHKGSTSFFNAEVILPGQLNSDRQLSNIEEPMAAAIAPTPNPLLSEVGQENRAETQRRDDDTIPWIDPITGQSILVNARTGAAVPPRPQRTRSEPGRNSTLTKMSCVREKLGSRDKAPNEENGGWLDGFLKTWDNPVFQQAEAAILEVASESPQPGTFDQLHNLHHPCTHTNVKDMFKIAGLPGESRLSKEGLKDAEVISQVDKKFILVKMKCTPSQTTPTENRQKGNKPPQILVLIDQHAADERCQVEQLLDNLCSPASTGATFISNLGHQSAVSTSMLSQPLPVQVSSREAELFTLRASHFAHWGILYDIHPASETKTVSREQKRDIMVQALPPAIVSRCVSDPKLLSELLRKEVWKMIENPGRGRGRAHSSRENTEVPLDAEGAQHQWVTRIGSCPEGIVELINSRACRSAIMFNDELSLEECRKLLQRLAKCAFPFQCAHGRPSMVPLVEMGSLTGEYARGFSETQVKQESFASAWKKWNEEAD